MDLWIQAIARIILENGAEPNVIGFGPSRETLLHRVAAGGFEHIVFCLLEVNFMSKENKERVC